MKALTNINPGTIGEAVTAAQQARTAGRAFAFSGGGTDLLQQIKDGTDPAEIIINLRTVTDNRGIAAANGGVTIGGGVTLRELAADPMLRSAFPALVEAAMSVGTPQIRNVATLAGNLTQRPWCWYYRNGFNCYKAGGNECFSVSGENGQHAIFGGGPSFIVHPSDLAPVLAALDAVFQVAGPNGSREVSVQDFFVLPATNPARENSLELGELLVGVTIPELGEDVVSTWHKIMDREAWTHAEVGVAAVIRRDGSEVRSASVVLGGVAPIPWRVAAVEDFLAGRQIDEAVAREAGGLAIAEAQPLSRNAHKLPLTSAAVERALLDLAAA